MIILGVALEVCATMSGTVGKQLLRYSGMAEESGKESLARLCLTAGLVLNVAGGPVLEIAAFGQAPQTLLAPLNGLDVLWNIMLVPYTLGENPSLTQFFGCLLIVGGTALTAIGGPHSEQPYTLDTMREKLLTLSALTYISVEVLLIVLGLLFMRGRPKGDRKRGFALGCVAGLIGGNLFFMKAASSLISVTVSSGLQAWKVWVASPLPLLVAAGAGGIGVATAVLLSSALREFDATMMVATYEGAFVISGCASGVAVLGELDTVSAHRRVLYAVGVLIAVAGVLAAQHQKQALTRHTVTPEEMVGYVNTLRRSSLIGGRDSLLGGRDSLLQVHENEA